MNIRWLIRFQSVITLASGMIYPYYLLFLKNLGNSYSKYGLAFAVFTVSSAAVSRYLGPRLDRFGREILALSSLGMMAAMLAFPWVGSYVWVLVLQAGMGLCSAMQRMSERLLLADYTDRGARGAGSGDLSFLDVGLFGIRGSGRWLSHRLAYDRRIVLFERALVCGKRLDGLAASRRNVP